MRLRIIRFEIMVLCADWYGLLLAAFLLLFIGFWVGRRIDRIVVTECKRCGKVDVGREKL
jgi:hypothetical protein